jgi:uncharacterized protein YijF (DUF1287 family)
MLTRRSVLAGLGGLPLTTLPRLPAPDWAETLVQAARAQIGITTRYEPAYVRLDYPGGDIPREAGVCTDVVIRAYRDALDIDLQRLVHEDMRTAFSSYPQIWGLTRPDRNIDHRRVPNLEHYFARQGRERPVPGERRDWQPGDLVSMRLGGRLPHIAIFCGHTRDGRARYIHNIGGGVQEEPIRPAFTDPRRFRFPPA